MRGAASRRRRAGVAACLTGAAALAFVSVVAKFPSAALAQTVLEYEEGSPNPQMLLEADTLVYDRDRNTITAVGGVRIEYDGNRLVAQRVTYDRNTARLMASGNVQIIERDGNKIYADQIDVTDDFGDGFVNTLRVETIDKTYFAAESAKRESGTLTTFNNGVYTACEPCEEKPDKPPIWRVKAQKIIWNGKTKIVRFEQAQFEFFGFPIAYLPFFEVADPTVERKSGFLFPGFRQSEELGFGLRVPYYFALSPTYDLTVAVTGYTKQGFLGEAEWRQRFNNGQYSLKIAGIVQQDPDAFRGPRGGDRVGSQVTNRGMIGTKGNFRINPRWTFGWDVLAQTDKNFSHMYSIGGYSDRVHRSEVYLTGLDDRNYFDLRGMKFDIQENAPSPRGRDDEQPWVLPSFDYSRIPDMPIAGGELTIDINAQGLKRNELSFIDPAGGDPIPESRLPGAEGTSGRVTAEAEWKRSLVTSSGLVATPLLAARADGIFTDYSAATISAINNDFMIDGSPVAADIRSSYHRTMATAGVELRWPILFATENSSHVIEPIAQVFVRPNEPYASTIGIPNEDAQSLVFDATTLFERDKFSGYDRIEGGSRANVGFRYSGSFAGGWTSNAIFGQSYHLGGVNSFASPDLVNVGAFSGLETDVSDFVGLVGLASPNGFEAAVGARLDEKTFEPRRVDATVGYISRPFKASLQYAYIQAQPLYGFDEDRREITAKTTVRLHDYWSAFGSGTYDLESRTLVSSSLGFAYDDECFLYAMTYKRSENRNTNEVSHKIGFNISFRTIGDFGTNTNEVAGF